MNWSGADFEHMAHALRLAERGLYTCSPNPRVGCVLVRDNAVIAEGWHERAGLPHAEVNALSAAGAAARGAACYVTLEPCAHTGRTPPCTDALVAAGVGAVIAAMIDPNPRVAGRGMKILEAAGISTRTGVLEAQARELNPGFVRRMATGLPFVRCKLALSLDGGTAAPDGSSKWITCEAARADVQHWRARSCAIMTGIGTVLADDPRLDVRLDGAGDRRPLRCVMDRGLRMPPAAAMLALPGRTLVFTRSAAQGRREALQQAGAEVIVLDCGDDAFAEATLRHLAEREEVNEVLLESGSTLAGALLARGLVQELVLYQAPVLLGDGARGLVHLPGITGIDDRIRLQVTDVRSVGRDRRLICRPVADNDNAAT